MQTYSAPCPSPLIPVVSFISAAASERPSKPAAALTLGQRDRCVNPERVLAATKEPVSLPLSSHVSPSLSLPFHPPSLRRGEEGAGLITSTGQR